jgi:hypothetical protein
VGRTVDPLSRESAAWSLVSHIRILRASMMPALPWATSGALHSVVGVACALPRRSADLIDEPETMLGKSGLHRRALGDLVDKPQQRVARRQPIEQLVDQAAIEQPVDYLRGTVTVECLLQRRLDPRAVQHANHDPLQLAALKHAINGAPLHAQPDPDDNVDRVGYRAERACGGAAA